MQRAAMSVDKVVEETVGGFSRWHLYTVAVIALLKVTLPWHMLGIVFLAPPAAFHCSVNTTEGCSLDCPSRHFDRSVFKDTIITEWDLVCENAQLVNVAQLIFMFGILLGNLLFGYVSDRFGRREPLLWAVVLQILSGIATAFTPWLWLFMVLRLISGIATGGSMLTTLVLLMEIIGRKYRMTFGILFQLPSVGGHALMGFLGYLLRDWHHFQITISAPSILLLSCYWLLPESPRWLLTVGRTEEAVRVLEKAASLSNRPTEQIKNVIDKYVKQQTTSPGQPGRLLDLFRTAEIRKRSFCVFVCWFINGLTYFAVVQYMGRLAGNIFLNISLSGLVQLPGNLIVWYMLHKLSRKRTLTVMNVLSAGACLAIIFIEDDKSEVTAALGIVGIMGMAGSFTVLYVFSSELYPTVIRNTGLGAASMTGRIGSMLAPFVASLDVVNSWLAPLIFGVGPLICILTYFFLPETSNSKLPDTLDEAETLGTSNAPKNKDTDTDITPL